MARILICDDSMFMRDRMTKFLESEGHEVIMASNGEEAVAQFSAYLPDLAFLDITMPIMDGITAVEHIMAKHPEAKLIMLSAMGQKTRIFAAIKSGACFFLIKPFDPERIRETIERFLNPSPV